MAISTNSNILIEGNTFDLGNVGIAGAIHYQNLILLNLDPNGAADPADGNGPGYAVINSNYLNGVIADGYHIVVNSGSANITDNTFLGPGNTQNSVPVTAYINVSGSKFDQIITNNIFDSPTVDGINGTNEQLVIGPGTNGALTPNTLYTNNKNQTSYLPISKVPNLVDFTHFNTNVDASTPPDPVQAFYFYTTNSGNSGAYYSSRYGSFLGPGITIPATAGPFNYYPVAEGTELRWGSAGTIASVIYLVTVDVDEYLPPNVQILNFTIGLSAIANTAANLQVLAPAGGSTSLYQMWVSTSVSKNPNFAYTSGNLTTALAQTVADVNFTVSSGGSAAAAGFAVLAGSTVTNTATPTVVNGNLGLYPGTSVTNFPPGTVNGTQYIADATAQAAQAALTARYVAAQALPGGTVIPGGVIAGGTTLIPGVYTATSSLNFTGGTVTLNGAGNYTFQIASTLITASGTTIVLAGGATATNVTWAVGSSATLGTTTTFVGSILAQASITDNGGSTVAGQLLAQTAAVNLNNTTVTNAVTPPPFVGSQQSVGLTVVPSASSPPASVTPAQLTSATQYLFLDVSSLPQFYTVMPDTRITVVYQAETNMDTSMGGGVSANGYVDVFESPLIVKYRW